MSRGWRIEGIDRIKMCIGYMRFNYGWTYNEIRDALIRKHVVKDEQDFEQMMIMIDG